MPDVHLRLVLYKRIAAAADDEALTELEAEMIDRFGPLLPPIRNLYRVARLTLRAQALGLSRFDVGPLGGVIEFGSEHRVDPAAVLKLVQKEPRSYRLDGPDRLRFTRRSETAEARVAAADALLALLGAR
jgi:transcription-repair coupling factor (superfamily II helicase)